MRNLGCSCSRRLFILAAVVVVNLVSLPAFAFPSWMGVYGSFQRHDGANPGTFTVLMNQDYLGLHAEVGIRVNGGSWNTYAMSYAGNVNGNSQWQFTPGGMFPPTQIVEFYFHGWDNWGGNIWDSNYGQNYWFPAGHNGIVQWIGNTWHYPSSGQIDAGENFWVNIESWPPGAAKEGRIVYTINRGLTWIWLPLSFNGQAGNNDTWHVNLGSFGAASTVRYALEVTDWAGNVHWANNGGFDYYAQVNYDPSGDADGDGMPNGWEMAKGFDPTDPIDGKDDLDGDELDNALEYAAGSDPAVQDSDADLLADAIEVLGTQTSPTNANAHVLQTALAVDGSSATNFLGPWNVQGAHIVAATNRGAVEYVLNVPASDTYILEIEGANTPFIENVSTPADLDLYVDGMYLHRVTLAATPTSSVVRCVTPYLPYGTHTLRVVWDNVRYYNRLRLSSVKLLTVEGTDSDADGIKDWVENWTIARNGADVLPPISAVSPAFIEGRVAHWNAMSISGGLTLRHGAGRRWYSNVPLSQETSTPVAVTFENGALQEQGQIIWRPTNILLDDDMTIRTGDSLLLTAYPLGAMTGLVQVQVQGGGTYTTSLENPVSVEFSQAGTYVVDGSFQADGQETNGTLVVTVASASFPASPAAWVGRVRSWTCPDVTMNALVEADSSLRIAESPNTNANGRGFHILARESKPAHIVARLGAGGPIIDDVAVRGFRVYSAGEVYLRVAQTYPDGTHLVEMAVVQHPVLSDTHAELEIFAGGVTFEDGTLYREIVSQDYDTLGQTTVRFFRAPGVQNSTCHNFEMYQAGQLLGRRVQ